MRSRLLRRTTLIRAGSAGLAAVLTAAVLSTVATGAASGAGAAPADGTVARNDATGKVGFIGTAAGHPIDSGFSAAAPAAKVADSFVMSRAKELGLSGSTLTVSEQHATAGGTAVRLDQVVDGVQVFGGQFVVNLDKDNNVLSVLGEASPVSAVSTTPKVAASAAAGRATATVAKSEKVAAGALTAATPVLRLYDPRLLGAPGPFQTGRLAWVTDVTAQQQGANVVDQTVVVDAATGAVALAFSNIAEAKNRTVCDANNTPTQYPCTTPVWTESSQPLPQDTDVQLAFKYAGDVYDFYSSRFGRDSLDGHGLPLRSTTDFCPSLAPADCPYENAFWDGEQMVYGDGFASADDVVGHELTHGVTDFTSGLFYYQQSGAINESFSDIFGEFIDLTNTGGTDTPDVRWAIGEDVPGFGAIRNMKDPTIFGDPDRMLSPYYFSDPNERDGGGVHLNSGVGNKSAYLMTDGGTFNGQTVTGLGLEKAAQLYYTVDTSMLVSGSDYADLANASAAGVRQPRHRQGQGDHDRGLRPGREGACSPPRWTRTPPTRPPRSRRCVRRAGP